MRRIWTLTLFVVAVAASIVAAREYGKSHRADARRTDTPATLTDEQYAALLDKMFVKLDFDHQAWHTDTQHAVEAVAELAEGGSRQTAEGYYALGLRLAGERKFVSAEQAYRKAIQIRPEWSWPYSGLGLALFELGRQEEAMKIFAKASELDPTSSMPHNILSVLLRLDHRLDEAEKEASIAVKLAPDRLETLNTYANVLKEQGKTEEARECYRRAIAADPNHPTPYYNLACLHALDGDKEEALALLEQAVALEPLFVTYAREDKDLASLKNEPRFRKLIAKSPA